MDITACSSLCFFLLSFYVLYMLFRYVYYGLFVRFAVCFILLMERKGPGSYYCWFFAAVFCCFHVPAAATDNASRGIKDVAVNVLPGHTKSLRNPVN
jgi:hypothetical protein